MKRLGHLNSAVGMNSAIMPQLVTTLSSALAENREEWLRSLQMKQKFAIINEQHSPHFPRAFELLNKTNQFNTTGKRWEVREIEDLFSRGGFLLATWLSDRNADNGLVGLSVVEGDQIVQAVLSCRVFGLGAEINMIRETCKIIFDGHRIVHGIIAPTAKNFASLDIFERCGFSNYDAGVFTSNALPAATAWIELT